MSASEWCWRLVGVQHILIIDIPIEFATHCQARSPRGSIIKITQLNSVDRGCAVERLAHSAVIRVAVAVPVVQRGHCRAVAEAS